MFLSLMILVFDMLSFEHFQLAYKEVTLLDYEIFLENLFSYLEDAERLLIVNNNY